MSALTPQIELSNYQNLLQVNENFLEVLKKERHDVLDKHLKGSLPINTVNEKLLYIKKEEKDTKKLIEKYKAKILELNLRPK